MGKSDVEQELDESLAERVSVETPREENAFRIYAKAWKFDYDKLSYDEIRSHVKNVGMPRYVARIFPDFRRLSVLDLGSADGYYSAAFEMLGARRVVGIEGNVSAFLRSLVLKNALNLRCHFLLGDFTKFVNQDNINYDLIYASGVLYHLQDPVEFLMRCAQVTPRLYLWTHYYDEEKLRNHPFERERFIAEKNQEKLCQGEKFTYYYREYDVDSVVSPKYIGGLHRYACRLNHDDLLRALTLAGFNVEHTLEDSVNGDPAINIVACKPGIKLKKMDKSFGIIVKQRNKINKWQNVSQSILKYLRLRS